MEIQSVRLEQDGGTRPGRSSRPCPTEQMRPFERLAAKFGVSPTQAGSLRDFVAAMQIDTPCDQPDPDDEFSAIFGSHEQRLAKLSMMRTAASGLLAVLTPVQRRSAERVLPFCGLPRTN
jgi:hypothetical protein